MEGALLGLNGWLEAIGMVGWARGSANVYPWANVVHVIGVVLLLGGIGIVDLRILGAWRALPLAALSRALVPLAATGLAMQATSGIILFAADGEALAKSDTFHMKLVLVLLAAVNAASFRFVLAPAGLSDGRALPPLLRACAGASLAFWLAVAVLGRLIAYY